jgi:hypothetical protein
MSKRLIPPERMKEIGRWFSDCADFGVTSCVHMRHLVDWAAHDPSVPAERGELLAFVRANAPLGVIADLCNGTKHAALDRKPWSAEEVALAKAVGLRSSRDDHGVLVASARHTVTVGDRTTPLLELLDEGVNLWSAQRKNLGVGKGSDAA